MQPKGQQKLEKSLITLMLKIYEDENEFPNSFSRPKRFQLKRGEKADIATGYWFEINTATNTLILEGISSKFELDRCAPTLKLNVIDLISSKGSDRDYKIQFAVWRLGPDIFKRYLTPKLSSEKQAFIKSIQFDCLVQELLTIQSQCEGSQNNAKSRVLALLLTKLILAQHELAENKPGSETLFTNQCLQAIAEARESGGLDKHRNILGVLFKMVMCLLIVPAFYLAYTGRLTLLTNSEVKVNALQTQLEKSRFFKPAGIVHESSNIDQYRAVLNP